jgi:ATP-dependent 26S proteasome regulatory subunit
MLKMTVKKKAQHDKHKSVNNRKIVDIVKLSSRMRNVFRGKVKLNRSKLVVGARLTLNQMTHSIMQVLPRKVDPFVFNMMK